MTGSDGIPFARVAVVGAGAMGSVYADLMASAGYDVRAVTLWEDHAIAIKRSGLRVRGASGDRTVSITTWCAIGGWRCRELERPRGSILCVKKKWARTVLSHSAFCGVKRPHLDRLLVELREPWEAEGQRHQRRGRRRDRAAGAGRRHDLEYVDRVVVTLAVLRLRIPHARVAVMFGVDRSTVTRAVHQIRPLLAARGFATPEGPRPRTLDDVFAYADHHKVSLRVDGSEIQVRRPRASRAGRRAFVSGKKKQNT